MKGSLTTPFFYFVNSRVLNSVMKNIIYLFIIISFFLQRNILAQQSLNNSIVSFNNKVSNPVLDTGLILKGVIDFDLPSGGVSGKAIHLYALKPISNLSLYGIGVANNGGGSDGEEYTFPAVNLAYGAHVLLALDTLAMASYFDSCYSFFDTVFIANSMISHNGDDAIELFENGAIIETFGDPNVDGTGEPWEYKDSWAYKDTSGLLSFSGYNWVVAQINCTDGSITTSSSVCPYPFCASMPTPPPPPPPPPVNLTSINFQVDMSLVTDNYTNPEINGTFNGWCGNCNPLTDQDGNNIWEITLDLTPGDTIEYKFSADDWNIQEMMDPADFCTNTDSNQTNRVLIVPQTDSTLLDVCWGSCTICGLPPSFVNDKEKLISIYPNPANNLMQISSDQSISQIVVRDMLGKVKLNVNTSSNFYQLDISTLSSNIYFLEVKIGQDWFKKSISVVR